MFDTGLPQTSRVGSLMHVMTRLLLGIWLMRVLPLAVAAGAPAEPQSELIFPVESWHNHGSCVVETRRGDLLACWFHGSGERKSDDVRIEAARLRKGAKAWSPRFTLADVPGYPDTNPAMFVDPSNRLWLLHPTILAHTWESALMKVYISSDWQRSTPPRWDVMSVLPVTPGADFAPAVAAEIPRFEAQLGASGLDDASRREIHDFLAPMRAHRTNELYCRLGWMTRAHPVVVDGKRLIVPLYHDGFSFSLMALTDDWGKTWRTSNPLIGGGNIQPSIVQRNDGSLYTLMRDNGPAPHRLHQAESRDRGQTWSAVSDSVLPNPGSGAEILRLRNGHWVVIGNDTERGRHRLAVWWSADEGKTWPVRQCLEDATPGDNSFSYPSILEARDGSIHATYSVHLASGKSIRHVRFRENWLMAAPRE